MTEPAIIPIRTAMTEGSLSVIEAERDIPFAIKRTFWIYGVPPSGERGLHYHRVAEEVLICLSGSVSVLIDDGEYMRVFALSSKNEALYIPKMHWLEMAAFSTDCVLLVLASRHFDESECGRDYDEFLLLEKE